MVKTVEEVYGVGAMRALPAFLVGQRSPRTPRRVSSSPVYPD